ncbi:MAG: hypothetical protein VW258_07730 [Thalassolituus sp.]
MLMRVGSMIFAIPAIMLIALYGIDLSTAGQCIDIGQYYDFANDICSERPVPGSSYYQRHAAFVNIMLLLSVVGSLMMTWGMLVKGMQPKDQ